jgi:hypothetical protein
MKKTMTVTTDNLFDPVNCCRYPFLVTTTRKKQEMELKWKKKRKTIQAFSEFGRLVLANVFCSAG